MSWARGGGPRGDPHGARPPRGAGARAQGPRTPPPRPYLGPARRGPGPAPVTSGAPSARRSVPRPHVTRRAGRTRRRDPRAAARGTGRTPEVTSAAPPPADSSGPRLPGGGGGGLSPGPVSARPPRRGPFLAFGSGLRGRDPACLGGVARAGRGGAAVHLGACRRAPRPGRGLPRGLPWVRPRPRASARRGESGVWCPGSDSRGGLGTPGTRRWRPGEDRGVAPRGSRAGTGPVLRPVGP